MTGPITPSVSVEEMIAEITETLYEGSEYVVETVNGNLEYVIAGYFTYAIIVLLYRSLQEPESFWLYDVYTNPRREEFEKAYVVAIGFHMLVVLSHITGRVIVYLEWLLRPETSHTALSNGVMYYLILPARYALQPYRNALSSPEGFAWLAASITITLLAVALIVLYAQVRIRLDDENSDEDSDLAAEI